MVATVGIVCYTGPIIAPGIGLFVRPALIIGEMSYYPKETASP